MDITSEIMQIWLPVIIAALIQASFGLSVSVLTLLSGSALSHGKSKSNLKLMTTGHVLGAMVITSALVIDFLWLTSMIGWGYETAFWSILAALSTVVGLFVLLFYYKNDEKGTRLWLPRKLAEYIYNQTKKSKSFYSSLVLGCVSIMVELVFLVVPMMVAAYALSIAPIRIQLAGIAVYAIIANLPLIALAISYATGRKVSVIQRWREKNKRFMQISTGLLTIILGVYLLVYKILGAS